MIVYCIDLYVISPLVVTAKVLTCQETTERWVQTFFAYFIISHIKIKRISNPRPIRPGTVWHRSRAAVNSGFRLVLRKSRSISVAVFRCDFLSDPIQVVHQLIG